MTVVIKGVEYENIKNYRAFEEAQLCEKYEALQDMAIVLYMAAIEGAEYNIVHARLDTVESPDSK